MRIRTLLIALGMLFSSIGYTAINFGTLMFRPPFIISPRNGFDIDLAQLLCQRLQENCNFMPMGMDELYKELQKGDIDLAIGGIPISYNLETNFISSLPYMVYKGQFLVLKDNPIHSIKELQGTEIGVLRNALNGGVTYEYLLAHYPDFFQINRYNDLEDALADLHNKSVSALFLNRPSVIYWVNEGGDQFKSLGEADVIGDGIAIFALPKNKALIERINQVLGTMKKDNTLDNLYKTYFPDE